MGELVFLLHPEESVDDCLVLDLDAFGSSGGTGGIDDVGQVVWFLLKWQSVLGSVVECLFVGEYGVVAFRDERLGALVAEDGGGLCLLEDLSESFSWQVRFQGEVGSVCLECGVECGDPSMGSLHEDGDDLSALGGVLFDSVGDSVGESVELFVGEGLSGEADGLGLWCLVDLAFEEAGEGVVQWVVGRCLVEGVDESLGLFVSQEVGRVDRALGVFGECFERAEVGVGELGHGAFGPACRVVVQSEIDLGILAIGLSFEVGHEWEVGVFEDGGLIDVEGVDSFELVVDVEVVVVEGGGEEVLAASELLDSCQWQSSS